MTAWRIRMAIELVASLFLACLGVYVMTNDDWWWQGIGLFGSIIAINQFADKWGLFWDGPDE